MSPRESAKGGTSRLLHPSTWPVRWRLAFASASLTLAILLVFAAIIGNLASQRIHSDFNRELRSAVGTLASEIKIINTPSTGPIVVGPELDAFASSGGATVRVFDDHGNLLDETRNAAFMGSPRAGISDVGSLHIATERVVNPDTGKLTGYVQYGRSQEQVESTIEKLWLFIAAGVLGGTLLASLAGLAIANRAMRPIASLTATAREIATTRDPSRRMPQPPTEDEVGELAQTLEQMLRSLDAARAEREAAMHQQREFIADASHELRTPLTSVLANLELLQASLADPEHSEEREMLDSAVRSSQRMSRLVGDLLLLARADAGRISTRSDCDLRAIAEAVIAEVAPLSPSRKVQIVDGEPVHVQGNRDELHRMILNLLDNARVHTPEGSRIELRLSASDGAAQVDVADDGPGIPVDLREQVFNRFVRGSGPSDTAANPGTGLGLAIVRAVARSHGGDATASESDLGGALLRVRMPLSGSQRSGSSLKKELPTV